MFFPVPPRREAAADEKPKPPKPAPPPATPAPEETSIWHMKLNGLGILGALLGVGGAFAIGTSIGNPDGYQLSRLVIPGMVAGAVVGQFLGRLLGVR